MPLDDVLPKGDEATIEWAKFQEDLGKVDGWYAKSGGPFLMGNTASWADFAVAGSLVWMRSVWGREEHRMERHRVLAGKKMEGSFRQLEAVRNCGVDK